MWMYHGKLNEKKFEKFTDTLNVKVQTILETTVCFANDEIVRGKIVARWRDFSKTAETAVILRNPKTLSKNLSKRKRRNRGSGLAQAGGTSANLYAILPTLNASTIVGQTTVILFVFCWTLCKNFFYHAHLEFPKFYLILQNSFTQKINNFIKLNRG